MNLFLELSFIFFMGSMAGWVLEVLFRRFFSKANPERKWINPGFCTGPYVPLYGLGLSLAKRIVAMAGGEITVADAEGGGGKFTVTLKQSSSGGKECR